MAKQVNKYEQGGLILKKKTKDNFGKKANPNNVDVSVGPDFVGLGYNIKGRNYSPAWGGQFQNGGFLEPISYKLPSRYRIPYAEPSSELAMSIGGEGGEPAYLIPSFKYGKPLKDPIAEYKKTGEHLGGPFKTYQEADKWEQEVRHPYVEQGKPIPTPLKRWGDMAMGGNLPGAVGFTYARVAGSAPSNGKYAKKTKASAQNGQEMKFYQEGLDFTPKTISQNGIMIDPDGYWNSENWGNPVIIPSTDITMEGVDQPLIGISDTGDTQYMEPGEDYQFDGEYVTEYPILKDTNYNDMAKAKQGKKLNKAAMGKAMVYDQLHQLSDFGNPPIAQTGISTPPEFKFTKFGATADNPGGSFSGGMETAGMSALNNLGKIVSGIGAISEQKRNIKKADQAAQLSGLALQANQTMQEPMRRYVRPEDNIIQPGQLSNPYGSGTNYLAEDGAMIGGNPTEIQNMYNPGDIYLDGGYEPMEESLKQYKHGGSMHKAEFGEYFQDSGQAQIGSAVGESIGTAFGPAGAAVGKIAGMALGNLLGGAKDARKLQEQKDKMALSQSQLAFQQSRSQGPLNAYMEDGGWVSHDWQPQVIATFGEHKLKDLLKPPYDADMLRAGGHLKEYTPPSAAAMFTGRPPMPMAQDGVQMAMGGELQVGDGGYLETMSYNPNLPGGEIGMFRGASHDNGGIQTQYGDNQVEVEGGEPAVKLKDGGSSDNLVVFGNMKINTDIANLIGDPKAKGMKFKTYVADIAKNDAKQLKTIQKGLNLVEEYDKNNVFDQLSMNSGQAMVMGGTAYQKINADKIKEAGIVQDAIHQTAKQLGVKNDKLAEGKLEKETDPRMVAQDGTTLKSFLKTPYAERKKLAKELGYIDYAGKDLAQQEKLYDLFKSKSKPLAPGDGVRQLKPFSVNDLVPQFGPKKADITIPYQAGYVKPKVAVSNESDFHPPSIEDMPGDPTSKKKREKFDWDKASKFGEAALSNLAPFLRPRTKIGLDPQELYPELYSLATNQLEPVQAQTFQPMLDTPVDISFNDQLAAVDSQSRAAIRAAGSNPAAQAMIMSQALQAKKQILGERDRINTTNRVQVYDKNRAAINEAQLRNLQILDQQYVRQAQAKSATKAQSFEALKSIANKTAQNRLENQTLNIYENMYNYRFSPTGRAFNVNDPARFSIPEGIGKTSEEVRAYADLLAAQEKNKTKKSTTGRNGAIVNALKNL